MRRRGRIILGFPNDEGSDSGLSGSTSSKPPFHKTTRTLLSGGPAMSSSTLVFTDAPEKRSVRRCVPPQLVTASLLDGDGPRFGTLFNICHFGACITTDHPFASGKNVDVFLGFDFLPQSFAARARVVWTGSMPEDLDTGSRLLGVRFTVSARTSGKPSAAFSARESFRKVSAPRPQTITSRGCCWNWSRRSKRWEKSSSPSPCPPEPHPSGVRRRCLGR
jgi:PilZ domain